MLISHEVPTAYLGIADKFNDFFVARADRLKRDEAYAEFCKSQSKPIVLDSCFDPAEVSNTEILQLAKKIKATDVILPTFPKRKNDTIKAIEKFIENKLAEDFAWTIVPQGDSLGEYLRGIKELYDKKILSNPHVLCMGLPADLIAYLSFKDNLCFSDKDIYGCRPGLVDRLIHQNFTNNTKLHLMGLGDRGGREIAEYRFINAVHRVDTNHGWLITNAGYQLGLPTRGTSAMSSTDYEVDINWKFDEKAELNSDNSIMLDLNLSILNGLAQATVM